MASYTTNLNLKKPSGSENVAIGDINNNMDTIDTAYGTLNSKSTPVYRKASQTITFSNGIANVTFSSGVNLLAVNAVGSGATTDTYCIAGWSRTSGQTNYSIFLKTNASTSMNCDFIFTTDALSTDITIT